ncbi:TonB-linked SusC/RagA family outer membrane protein [Catalinimonas alkaloidigena]|uniref:SusC/RagA family TonB-linked outer membrane protein n=1 Tax=Catalinimonas alkaloidigena TaxID=1075417 RepID=UPI0024050E45|nr:TonB-dependent receptor [Catalinimonas alkaloidigena]MDF9796431.1 TonB-linked SusC/RagA family outer membrane protein [Catalinimonas alkaloidigena]
MKKCRLLLNLIFVALLLYNPAVAIAQNLALNEGELTRHADQQEQSLASLISVLETRYQVNISYDHEAISDKLVKTPAIFKEELEENLEMILEPFQLRFKKLEKGYYVIQEESLQNGIKKIESNPSSPESKGADDSADGVASPSLFSSLGSVVQKQLEKSISGTVTDIENDEPLPGTNVVVKGTTIGTVTDIDGNYRLSVPDDASILVFSSVGYTSEEIEIGNQTVINVSMSSDIQSLSEVVVIGYGAVEKKDVTGAIASVESKDIVRANPVQAAKAIQGQVAGVNVTRANGRPGAGYNINIRGLNSINFSNEPLVVIDGVMGGDLNALNPTDIESMDVLKDASATAIYGSRGANGVIIISTKRGATGKPQVTYDGYVGVKTPAHLPDMQNAQEFYKASVTDNEMDGGSPPTLTTTEQDMVDNGKSTDWVDEVTDPTSQTSHTVSVGGGSDNTNYYFSGGYLKEGGNLLNTKFERYNINGSMDSKLNNIVKVGFTSNYSFSNQVLGSNEALRSAYRARPTGVIYYDDILNPDENKDLDWNGYAVWMGIDDKQVLNPLVEAHPDNFQDETRKNNFFGNAYVEITPVEGLSIKSSLSASFLNERWGQFRGTFTKSQKTTRNPMAYRNTTMLSNFTLDNIISYNKSIGEHDVTITGVQSAFQERTEVMNSRVNNLPYNSLWYAMGTSSTIDGFNTNLVERALLSYMGRVMYDFQDKYLLTLTGRWDGASQLSEGNQWAFFPSAAIAWRLGDEGFIQNINTISDAKIRVSYGFVGNSSVAPYSTLANLINTGYDFGGTPAFGFAPGNLGNKDLVWEKSQELNIGMDLGLIQNRIYTSLEIYNRKTVDLILSQKIPTSTGYGEVISNIGEVNNKGVELALTTINVANTNFKWSTNINFSTNKNEILELYGGGIDEDIGNKLFVGEPLGANYDYEFDGIWQLDEADEAEVYEQVPGSVKVVDQNDDGLITSDEDRVVLGSTQPKWLMGITNRFTFNQFDLSFLIYTSQGAQYRNSMLSGTMGEVQRGRYNALDLNYWTSENPTNDYYSGAVSNPYRGAIQYQDASFLRISDITLGYTLSDTMLNRLGLSNFRAYTQVINPFVFHNFDGMDPEYNTGTYNDDVPSATYLIGINLSF